MFSLQAVSEDHWPQTLTYQALLRVVSLNGGIVASNKFLCLQDQLVDYRGICIVFERFINTCEVDAKLNIY